MFSFCFLFVALRYHIQSFNIQVTIQPNHTIIIHAQRFCSNYPPKSITQTKLCDKVVVIILCALNFLLKDQARTPFPLCVFRKRYLRIITNATSVSSVRIFHPTLCLDINVDINDISSYVFKLLSRECEAGLN